jgi:hypothetical protein
MNECIICGSAISLKSRTNKCKKCRKKERKEERQKSGLCPKCGKNEAKLGSNCEGCIINARQNYFLRKIKAMLHYGNKCFCCGETRIAFLCIDHVNGGGNEHRREIGRRIYEWLIRNKYPPGFRVSCSNCNSGASLNGGKCPHGS